MSIKVALIDPNGSHPISIDRCSKSPMFTEQEAKLLKTKLITVLEELEAMRDPSNEDK